MNDTSVYSATEDNAAYIAVILINTASVGSYHMVATQTVNLKYYW